MLLDIELPPEIAARYVEEARARGVSLEKHLRDRLIENARATSTIEMTPQERARAFREWAESFPARPLLSDEAISREGLYETGDC